MMACHQRVVGCYYLFGCIAFGLSFVVSRADDFEVSWQFTTTYDDVFFIDERIRLNCTVNGAVGYQNISIYFNGTLIYGSGSLIREYQNQFNESSTRNSVGLAIEVSLMHEGIYRCEVWNGSHVTMDHFKLNVESTWPQCITKCVEENIKYLCYTKSTKDHHMSWMKSVDGGNFMIYTHFQVVTSWLKIIGISKKLTPKHDNSTYKCFYNNRTGDTQTDQSRSCTFPLLTMVGEASVDATPFTSTSENHPDYVPYTQGQIPYVTTEGVEGDSVGSQSSTLSTGAIVGMGVAVIVIACLVITAVVFVVKWQMSKGKREDDDHVRPVTNGNNTGTTVSSTSFINVSLDRCEQRDTLNGRDANDNDAYNRLKRDMTTIDGSYADLRGDDAQYYVPGRQEQDERDMVNPVASYAGSRRDDASYDEVPGRRDKDVRDLVNPGASNTSIRQNNSPNNVPGLRQEQDGRDMVNPGASTISAISRPVNAPYNVPGRQGHDRRNILSPDVSYAGSRRRDAPYDVPGQKEQDKWNVVNSDASSADSRRGDAPYDVPGEREQGKAAEFGPYKVVSIDEIHKATSGRDFTESPGYDTVGPGTSEGKSGMVHYEVLDSTKEGHH